MIFTKRLADGTVERYRAVYEPRHYTVSPAELELLRGIATSQSYDQAINGGALKGWTEEQRLQRDGKSWVVVRGSGTEHVAEIELKPDGGTGEVIPWPPERAWELALEHDKQIGGVIYGHDIHTIAMIGTGRA